MESDSKEIWDVVESDTEDEVEIETNFNRAKNVLCTGAGIFYNSLTTAQCKELWVLAANHAEIISANGEDSYSHHVPTNTTSWSVWIFNHELRIGKGLFFSLSSSSVQFARLRIITVEWDSLSAEPILDFCRRHPLLRELHISCPCSARVVDPVKLAEYVEENPRLFKLVAKGNMAKTFKQTIMSTKCARNRRAFRRAKDAALSFLLVQRRGWRNGPKGEFLPRDVARLVAMQIWETRLDTYAW